ncbi:MAG: hypothetical protein NZ561_04615 [Phycisphaerae bacterium]|nr:hypothetical protein [Phycisphaerae bacterium]MDW8261399.1 hypothetical protein [Phycisphaerales bacterium]
MSQEIPANSGANSPLAQTFQDAYQKAVTIKRLDEQIAQLAARRKALCEELRTIQSHLNEEFSSLLDMEPPASGELPGGAKVSVSVHPGAFAGRAAADAAV